MKTILLDFCYQKQFFSFHLFFGIHWNENEQTLNQILTSFSSGIIHLVPINVSEMTKVFSNNEKDFGTGSSKYLKAACLDTSGNNIHIKSIKMF